MPLIEKDGKLRYLPASYPLPEGWQVLNDSPDSELEASARGYYASLLKEEAEARASQVYGVPITPEFYDLLVDVLLSTTNFNVSNLRPDLLTVKNISDSCRNAIATTGAMTVEQLYNYDVSTDPNWP